MSGNNIHLPFGITVNLPERVLKQVKETFGNSVSSLWEPMVEYLEENNNVFDGTTAAEINKYNKQLYNLGTIMGAKEHNKFNKMF